MRCGYNIKDIVSNEVYSLLEQSIQNQNFLQQDLKHQFDQFKRTIDQKTVNSKKVTRPVENNNFSSYETSDLKFAQSFSNPEIDHSKTHEQEFDLERSFQSRFNLYSDKNLLEQLEIKKNTDLDNLIDKCIKLFFLKI